MSDARACHMRCGADGECHEKCPKPWALLQEQCGKMEHILTCHSSCKCDHACHVKCPLPACPKMQALVNDTLKCHGACAADRACHQKCPKPFLSMRERCDALEKSVQCHKACQPGDFACHHGCPHAVQDHHHHHHEDSHHAHHYGHSHEHGHHHVPEEFKKVFTAARIHV
eukprot:CAMPEP_0171057832 /NCGR_PEP_ID=MMETSP0766_2-20121228/2064_1 /TAXON_ID=439317 /ORGANISM="Gambierdiscus australes, Strain CAWD 149" /LENGTH=169 /DNA_ID=CAMNT_0011513021 /DNA_START=289 /DNA_END=798 /DNA_ORIENTATION=-